MATRTSLYSFQNNIIEIVISIDAIGEIYSPNMPLTKEERIKFGLLDGDNPWKDLGVPDFVLEKVKEESNVETENINENKGYPSSWSSNQNQTNGAEVRKRSLSTASISTEDITFEMEEFSKAWCDAEESLPPEEMFDVLEPPRILISSISSHVKRSKMSTPSSIARELNGNGRYHHVTNNYDRNVDNNGNNNERNDCKNNYMQNHYNGNQLNFDSSGDVTGLYQNL